MAVLRGGIVRRLPEKRIADNPGSKRKFFSDPGMPPEMSL